MGYIECNNPSLNERILRTSRAPPPNLTQHGMPEESSSQGQMSEKKIDTPGFGPDNLTQARPEFGLEINTTFQQPAMLTMPPFQTHNMDLNRCSLL
jgi:hypothetical protein